MVRLILFLLARHNLWLRPLSWFTRFGHGLFILYGLGAWFRPKNEKEQRKERKTLLYCLFSVILASSVFVVYWQIVVSAEAFCSR